MADKILTDYKSPVTSEGVRESLRSFMPPGRYHGFDQMVAGTVGANPIKAKIQHSETIRLEDGLEYAALFSPQGLLLYTQATHEDSLPANGGALYRCHLVYATVSLDTAVPNNSSYVLHIAATFTDIADYHDIDMYSLLPDVTTDVALGLIVINPGGSLIGDCLYVKYAQQPFGYETPAADDLAWRTKDNIFSGINTPSSVSVTWAAAVPLGSAVRLTEQATTIDCNGVVGGEISGFIWAKPTGDEEFPVGTQLAINLINTSDNIDIDGDYTSGSSIYLGDSRSNFPTRDGVYIFQKIKASGAGSWVLAEAFPTFYALAVLSTGKTWIDLNVLPSEISNPCSAASFQYRIDSNGDLRLKGQFTISTPESSGFLTTAFGNIMVGAYSESILEMHLGTTNQDAMESPNRIFIRLSSTGQLYTTPGEAGGDNTDKTFYLSERIITKQ